MLLDKDAFENALKQDMAAAAQGIPVTDASKKPQKGALFGPATDL